MIDMLKEVWRYRYVVVVQTWATLRASNVNTRLGPLWWFFEPLAMMFVYYFVLHTMMGRGGPGYHVFVLSALIVWKWFSQSVSQSAGTFVRNRNLILQVRFPLLCLIVAPILANLFHTLLGVAVVLLFALRVPGLELLYLVPLFLVQFLFTLGLSVLVSIVNVYVRDLEHSLSAILRAWWFLSPVLYDVSLVLESDRVPEFAKTLFMLNPLATLLPAYRGVLLDGVAPDMAAVGACGAVSLVLVLLGTALLQAQQRVIPKMI
ncbi:ABC transporter permease [Azospirillum sp.]|uniref:ABC transporter permease n=1 Tax=Azospirillum sp. TaxID=34012 RepID=UPI002D4EF8CF|nr:ABC transporter permease [Azospirillum sp.]HYD64549.1 ABC transporter permease [Azospirillum sp.]